MLCTMLVGVLSDTHGYVDPRLGAAFDGVEAIVHAGDVGGIGVLDELRRIAPLHAVRGNNDEPLGGLGLPLHADFELGGMEFHLVHQLPHARPERSARVVVYGHSHRTLIEDRKGVIYLNPGAAGRIGFHKLQTAALLRIDGGVIDARIVELGARETLRRVGVPGRKVS
jgi:putative phosphoesterase